MDINIDTLIGEATAYDKKERVERNKPKSWLKSVSAFANGDGGILIWGISDSDEVIGIAITKRNCEMLFKLGKEKSTEVSKLCERIKM